MVPLYVAAVALLSSFGSFFTGTWPFTRDSDARLNCRPFLPRIFVETPPSADHAAIRQATSKLDSSFTKRFAQGDIDALSVAVVTSKGPLYEKNWGLLRAEDGQASPPVTSHDSYRAASNSKPFAILEGFVLEQRGALSWDDPVQKYLPDFKYRLDGYAPNSTASDPQDAPITLFQLATHMSGLGRDWPSGTATSFPNGTECSGPPPLNCLPFPEHSDLFRAIQTHHLVSPPSTYPLYSNTGFGTLGLALVAANRAASDNPSREPKSYAELLERDVFRPLGLNGSHFLKTEANKDSIVLPSVGSELTDFDFKDAMNAAGGQYVSLADAIKVVQMLLNPSQPGSIITPHSVTRWLRSVYEFDEDQLTGVGMAWEMIKHADSYGRLHKIHWKLGELPGYHTAIAVNPDSSYGVIVFIGGRYSDAAKLAYDTFEIMQPAFDKARAVAAAELYTGEWRSNDGNSSAVITLNKGTLYVERLVLNGSDVLPLFGASPKLALSSTYRRDEFRIATGLPGWNGLKHMACYPYWNGEDLWSMKNGAPINLLYFSHSSDHRRILHVPSVSVEMRR